ncbi:MULTISPECIES: hypothetical protein [unclassified Aquimarina]|uniref:hypothetical protein n=1 Tax=unclassified Aquimarina TaxID=2627091 RepID=UPI0018C94535|nr:MULTISPECIES: hypothetical protein [unclassified Aquimarina]MBG6130723.1 putative transcriptional regulator [Aquimarina sp. EL_35]MBG6151131.1 putative transcriptional regulator [Aquimarina sp. EL_32]
MLNTTNPNNYRYITRHLEIHILGGIKLNHLDNLRVTVSINKIGHETKLRHNIDLYNDNQVEKFVRRVAERIEIGTSIVRTILQDLTNELEQYRLEQLDTDDNEIPIKELSKSEENKAIKFLKSKDLLTKTNTLIGQSGVIGEETNRLLMYLIFTSRKSRNPLHCISLGTSGSGKTHLQSKVAELIPDHEKVEITVLSENAFYYFNRTELRNKLILIEDLDGAESVLYPLRELQSKRRITKTVVHKDRKGTTKTIHLTVEGPVSVAGCTTQESVYEDNSNRSFLLYIDESSEQDRKIMQYQRRACAGKINIEDEIKAKDFLQNVQMLLQPVKVINPYAEHLELPQSVFKPRRTNSHYLQLIEAITFYCQYQRLKKYDKQTGEEYIEATIEDIQAAHSLIHEVLLRKSDILSGACRNFFEMLKTYLKTQTQTTFTNKEIRHILRINPSNQKRYMLQLQDAGLIQKAKGDKRNGYQYQVTTYEDYNTTHAQIEQLFTNTIKQLEVQSSS